MTINLKERPILFSAPMVNAILNGSKTQTRRVVKLPKHHTWGNEYDGQIIYKDDQFKEFPVDELNCRYGQVGDQLWVRETWAAYRRTSYEYDEWELVESKDDLALYGAELSAVYKADNKSFPDRWKPSIFMPRWASRIQLEITNIGVERLQSISEEDAIAEGMSQAVADAIFNVDELTTFAASHLLTPHATNRILFESLWEKINGADSWAANPWVWCIEFKVIKP